jgi:hypothetical protein
MDFVKCRGCGLNHRSAGRDACPKCGHAYNGATAMSLPPTSTAADVGDDASPVAGGLGIKLVLAPVGMWVAFKVAVWVLSGGPGSAARAECAASCKGGYDACITNVDPSCRIVGEQLQCMVTDERRGAIADDIKGCDAQAVRCIEACPGR